MKKGLIIAGEAALLIAAWFVMKFLVGKPEITTESIVSFSTYLIICAAGIWFFNRNRDKKEE